jgi:hypothetical protein
LCPYVCKLVLYPPCKNFVTSKAVVHNGTCRSMAHVQLLGYNIDNNSSFLLNQSINLFNIGHSTWSGWASQELLISDSCFAKSTSVGRMNTNTKKRSSGRQTSRKDITSNI